MPGHYAPGHRRRLAAELRRLRVAAGLTGEQVAAQLAPLGRWSASKVSRIETGRVAVHHGDVDDLLDLYGVAHEPLRVELVGIARESGKKGWWQPYRDVLAEHVSLLLELEAGASALRVVHNQLVPALLQTPDYARVLIRAGHPGARAEQVERLVELRMGRKRVFERPDAPWLRVLLDEAALRRPVGGPAVMRAQLERLTEHSDAGDAVIQVIPFAHGEHIGMDSPFTILSFPGAADVVYLEQHTTAACVEDDRDTGLYRLFFDRIRTLALDPRRSRRLIAEAAEDLRRVH